MGRQQMIGKQAAVAVGRQTVEFAQPVFQRRQHAMADKLLLAAGHRLDRALVVGAA